MPVEVRLPDGGGVSLDHYLARLSILVADVTEDPSVDIEGVIVFLDHYDRKRKILDRVQANNMKGRSVGDTMKHFSTMDEVRPEREGREGDSQPMPKAVEGDVMHEVVIKALEDRLAVGIKRYGQPLRAWNGRDAAQDAFEEVLDLSVYLAQVRVEMAEMREIITEMVMVHSMGGSLDGGLVDRAKRVLGAP